MKSRNTGLATVQSMLLLAAAMFLLTGCSWFGDDAPPPPDLAQPAPPAPDKAAPPPEDDDFDEDELKPVPPPPKADLRNDSVAVVDGQPITVYDLEQRTGLLMATTPVPNTPEMRAKMRERALEDLENEMIRKLEAQKQDIVISTPEVDKRIKQIVEDNHIDLDRLKEVLAHEHVSIAALRSQIATDLLWQYMVQRMSSGRINIAPETIDAEMARIQASADKVHYGVNEIFIAVDNPEDDAKALKDIQGLYEQIKAGAPFTAIARQFSESPSGREGGYIGDVYDGQLAPELNKALATMKTGDVSEPIRAPGGYYILQLQQRFEPAGTKIAEDRPEDRVLPPTLPLVRLLLPLGNKPPKEWIEKAMTAGNAIVQQVPNCAGLATIAKNIQGAVFMNLGEVRLADLSPQIRTILSQTEPGRIVKPVLSEAGVEIFGRCDKPVIKLQAFKMPTRDQVESQMFNDQISALARRYMRDLKRKATIERREPGKKAELLKSPEPGEKPEPHPADAPPPPTGPTP